MRWRSAKSACGSASRRCSASARRGPRRRSRTAPEKIWLFDWSGKLLKTVEHTAFNTSGLAYGNGILYPLGNDDVIDGAFLIEAKTGKTLEHRALPLGGGGCHGGQFHDGKLWLVENRLNCLMRVDPKSWTPEWAMPIYAETDDTRRWHDMTFDDDGFLWLVTGNDSKTPQTGKAGLAKYDATTGECLEVVSFAPGSCDPHGLVFHNGKFISCDAGHHPAGPIRQARTPAGSSASRSRETAAYLTNTITAGEPRPRNLPVNFGTPLAPMLNAVMLSEFWLSE